MRWRQRPPVITDAEPSLEEDQRRRKRRYVLIMGLHVLGLIAGAVLAMLHLWWPALVVWAVAAPLRFVAALVANAGAAERVRQRLSE